MLTNYNGTAITYDGIGNPLNWRNSTRIVWYGRQMSLFTHDNGLLTNYSYNSDGIRTGKQFVGVNGNITGMVKYTLDGNTIVAENRNGTNIYYTYDDKGSIMGMIYGGENYIFSKNLQGDVIGIYNVDGQLVAKYQYNAFGEITAITDASGNDVSTNASHIANINPFRYRSYYYDTETGFYYLQSRYYDPVVCRMLSCDALEVIAATPTDFTDKNLFAYCDNNPVMRKDDGGDFWHIIAGAVVGAVVSAVSTAVEAIIEDGFDALKSKETWEDIGISAAFGAAGGALAATGLPPVTQVLGGAALSAGENIIEQGREKGFDKIDYTEVAVNAAVGAVSSRGNGLTKGTSKHLHKMGNNLGRSMFTSKIQRKYYFSQTRTLFYDNFKKDTFTDVKHEIWKLTYKGVAKAGSVSAS